MDFGLQRGWLPSDDLGHGPATYQLECCFQVEFRSSLEFQACPNDCDCDDGGGEGCIEAGMQDAEILEGMLTEMLGRLTLTSAYSYATLI